MYCFCNGGGAISTVSQSGLEAAMYLVELRLRWFEVCSRVSFKVVMRSLYLRGKLGAKLRRTKCFKVSFRTEAQCIWEVLILKGVLKPMSKEGGLTCRSRGTLQLPAFLTLHNSLAGPESWRV